jgi:hypothetical protein
MEDYGLFLYVQIDKSKSQIAAKQIGLPLSETEYEITMPFENNSVS